MNRQQGFAMTPERLLALYSRTAVSASILALLSIAPAAHAQTTDTWSSGASGLWNVAGNWSADVVPNNGTPTGATYNVNILDGVSTVTLNISAGINDLSLAKGNTLAMNNGETLTVNGPTVTNNGAIQVNGGAGNNGYFNIGGNTTLSGGGTITLSTTTSGGGFAYIDAAAGGLTLTNSGNTIQGTGIIGSGGLAMVNSAGGAIDSNVTGGTLLMNGSGTTNTGLLEATNGGTLAFNTTAVTNTGGNITAGGAGSVVSLFNTGVTGGTLNTTGGGTIESAGTTTLNGVTISTGSTYTASNNAATAVLGTLTNNGLIQLNGGNGSNGVFELNANTTLTGGGTVTLSTITSSGGNAFIQENAAGLTLTNTNNVIQGNGVIGNSGLTLVNSTGGTVDANVSGNTLTMNGGGGTTNTGLLEATNGGGLAFNGTAVTNTGGNITASGAGSVVSLLNTSVTGGTLNTTGGGAIESAATSTLNGVTISTGSTYTASNNATTVVLGTLTNKGTVNVSGGNGNSGLLSFGNAAALAETLQGAGTVNLTTTAAGGGASIIEQNVGGVTLTNVNNTIQGEGVIGNGGLTFVNETSGTVDANSTAGPLTTSLLLNGAGVTNSGLLEATNSGLLQISNVVNNAGGTVKATGASAIVYLFNGTISGGTLTTKSGGTIESGGTTTLNGVTISKSSVFTASNNSTTLLGGTTTTNEGLIQLNGGNGGNGFLSIDNNTTLSGAGTVTLSTNTANGGNAYIEQNLGGLTLTNTNNLIQGNGVIGNGGLTLVNSKAGTIDANVSGGTLVLNGGGGITNTGLLEATNGGTLAFGAVVTNTAGNITASGTGSLVSLNNSSVKGGTLNTSGGGTIESLNTVTLNGVTISTGSTYTASNGSTTLVDGTITNDGVIQVNGGAGNNGFFNPNTNTTLTGGGTVTLATTTSGGGFAYIEQNVGGLTLTNTNNLIQGSGIIGNGGLKVINSAGGTISSNAVGGTLLLNGSGGLTNQGTLAVSSGDLLHVASGPFTNFSGTTLTGGTYNVAGTLEIDELGSAGGEIVTDAANIILNGSGSSFVDSAGKNALSNLATIAAASSFSLLGGRNFTTAGNFTNNGTLSVGAGSTFDVTGSLTNFSGTTLTGGSYDVTGTLEFPGANIVTNASNIALTGSAAEIVNATTSGNGLANFAINSTKGGFSVLGGLSFTTGGNFTNDGVLTVGTGSTFAVAPTASLTNFSGTTLTAGTFEVLGTLEFAGANIKTNAANVTLSGPAAEIENSTTSTNGLVNFDENAAKGSFTLLAGANFTTSGTFDNLGTLSVGSGSTFDASGGLTNFRSANSTLTGGTYDVTGTLEFPGAHIATNAAKITLIGPSAEIENSTTSGNGLAPFAANTSKGSFTLSSNANFTTTASGGFSNAGTVSIGSGSTFTVGGNGTFTQTAGTTNDGGTLVASGGVALSSGSLVGAGTITGNLTSTGIITPGASATKTGVLTDAGTYTQNAGGSLDIDIGGATSTKFNALDSTTAVLGGTLNISDVKGFVPTVGSTFKILNFSSETGTFATVTGLTINSSEAYTVTYQGTDVLLTVVSTPAPVAPAITDTHLAASRNLPEEYQLRMAAALKQFNASYADERMRVNAPSASLARLVAAKPLFAKDLMRLHR